MLQANQAKHYNEAGVGRALKHAFDELGYKREDFWVQTKCGLFCLCSHPYALLSAHPCLPAVELHTFGV